MGETGGSKYGSPIVVQVMRGRGSMMNAQGQCHCSAVQRLVMHLARAVRRQSRLSQSMMVLHTFHWHFCYALMYTRLSRVLAFFKLAFRRRTCRGMRDRPSLETNQLRQSGLRLRGRRAFKLISGLFLAGLRGASKTWNAARGRKAWTRPGRQQRHEQASKQAGRSEAHARKVSQRSAALPIRVQRQVLEQACLCANVCPVKLLTGRGADTRIFSP